jgi:hypothetical protein
MLYIRHHVCLIHNALFNCSSICRLLRIQFIFCVSMRFNLYLLCLSFFTLCLIFSCPSVPSHANFQLHFEEEALLGILNILLNSIPRPSVVYFLYIVIYSLLME